MCFFVTNGGVRSMPGIDDGIFGQGEYFFLYHLHQQCVAAGGKVAAPHAALENKVSANHEIVGGAIQGDTAVAVAWGVEHLQALCSEAHLVALMEKLGRCGHVVHRESERHGVSV